MRPWALAVLALLAAGCVEAPPPRAVKAVVEVPRDVGPKAPEVLVPASVDFDIVNLSLDGRFLYWAHRGEKGLLEVPIGGGPPVTLVAGTEDPVTSLAADATYLYFTTGHRVDTEASDMLLGRRSPRAGHFEGVVNRLKKEPGAKVEEIASGRFRPEDVAVDATNVYWINSKKDAILVRQPLGQVDSQAVVTHGNFLPGSFVVSGGFGYWIDLDAGPAVVRVSTNGGEPQKVATSTSTSGIGHPVRLAADDAAVYLTDAGSVEGKGSVLRVAVAGGAATLLADNLNAPRAVAVRGGWVYWLNKGTGAKNFLDGSLEKAPVTGGPKVTLAAGLAAPERLAVGDTRVAWTEVTGAIKDMAR